jgi:hypothetical protein
MPFTPPKRFNTPYVSSLLQIFQDSTRMKILNQNSNTLLLTSTIIGLEPPKETSNSCRKKTFYLTCFKASMYLPIYKHKPISQKLCRMLKTLLYLREDPPTQTVPSWQCIYHEDSSIFKSHKWRHVSILQCQSLWQPSLAHPPTHLLTKKDLVLHHLSI